MRHLFSVLSSFLAGALLCAAPAAQAANHVEGRSWAYGNVTALFSPNWGATVMPGFRYEMSDSQGEAGRAVMYELFAGPMFMQRWGNWSLKLPLWYYYMGFPIRATDDYFDSHNLELVPIVAYGTGAWTFVSRTIFHNKLYARNAVFKTESQRRGYSLLVRQMGRVFYRLTPTIRLTVADEIFVGVVEDGETSALAKGEPFFEKEGFSMNRVYAGAEFGLGNGLTLSPQYILETHHDPDGGELTRTRHYLFASLTWAVKLF